MIRKSAKGYTVVSKDGKKTMGTYSTKAGAQKRLAQVCLLYTSDAADDS